MADEAKYTADQIAIAARELRQASGADDQFFTATEAIGMLQEEIHLLRERGFSDESIADLLIGFDIEVTADDILHHTPKSW
jgi:hypothetical protein